MSLVRYLFSRAFSRLCVVVVVVVVVVVEYCGNNAASNVVLCEMNRIRD